ncbi:threonine--tRNA ligase [Microlunatus parietis]|uniref:Threonine--tRNA ligase n=1 Tax=Microlunatus parietis TaxID=682979 RepID=A0A7Y9I2D4_9ACTN|nr:threonine--tRNA ligase [Microlunatus parietis]NYE68721.1 threonyl-tRNA synthetase [Microlunatus parietis]
MIDNDARPAVRDHREIGRAMGVFAGHPDVGAGLPLWLPAGAVIRHELEQFAREVALASGCQPVYSPVLGKRALFERSGHWEKFSDDMFPPMPVGGDQLVLRPANCPHHAMIYAAEQHSYRELPVRYNELAPMFRSEPSGSLSGLSRVRQIDLDDTHVFCRPDQLRDEVVLALDALLDAFAVLGIDVEYLRLSCRDDGPGYLGSADQWRQAEDELRAVVSGRGLDWREAPGEAAFYGPKIDVQVLDAAGKEESIATVQLDFNQPERFDLSYIGEDGAAHRVLMIHRGIIGSMERMAAFLLEAYDGRLPLWLAPVQLCLLPISAAQRDAADDAVRLLRAAGVRVRVEPDGSLGRRIQESRSRRDALIGVIGASEAGAGEIMVDDPASGSRARLKIARLAELIMEAVGRRGRRVLLA